MIDPISLAVGAGLFIAGLVTGRLRRRQTGTQPTQAICGCKHGLDQHDPQTKKCHGQTLRKNAYGPEGGWIGDQWVDCTCRQYVGPVPIEQLYATPLLPPNETT